MRRLRALAQGQRGAAVVEFALVAPILFLVLVASFDFARAVNAYVIVGNASREGARYAALHPGATAQAIHDYLATRIAPLDPSALVLSPPDYTRTTDPRWAAGAPAPVTISVTVSYTWVATTALVGAFFWAESGSRTFVSSSTVEAIE